MPHVGQHASWVGGRDSGCHTCARRADHAPSFGECPLLLTNEILHHLWQPATRHGVGPPPRAPPNLTLRGMCWCPRKKGSNVHKSCTTSSLCNIDPWGFMGGSYGMPCCAHRWVVLQGVGGEVVQDFVRQPTEAMRTQPVTCGEALAEVGPNIESWPCGRGCNFHSRGRM